MHKCGFGRNTQGKKFSLRKTTINKFSNGGKIIKLKKVAALVAAGAVATNLVACSSFSGGSATTAAAAETKAEETTAAAAKVGEAKGIKVGFTNSYNGNSYRQTEENMKTLEKLLDLVGTCEVIDMTHPLEEKIPHWPTQPEVKFHTGMNYVEDGSYWRGVTLCEHSGSDHDRGHSFLCAVQDKIWYESSYGWPET